MQPRLLHEPLRLAGASLLRLQSDGRLVALARDGHDPAFAAIDDRYRGALVRYCTRLLGPARAEDAVQQTLLNAHQAMKDADHDIQLRPWLYRIAHNVSMNVLRGARETTELSSESADTVVVEDVVAQRQQLRETIAAIEALPAPQRDALLLRELEGRSHDEIAAALGVSVGGARQHLYRARASVRAAVTAITPYPLLARLMEMATSSGAGESTMARASEVAVGTGMGAVATKVGVSALAAGALVGGAIHADRVVDHHAHKSHTTSVHTVQDVVASPAAPVAAAAGVVGASNSSSSSGSQSGTLGGGDDGAHGTTTHHRHHVSGSGSGSSGSGSSGSGSGGHGSDDKAAGVALSGGGDASDDHGGRHGSGSGGTLGSSGHHAGDGGDDDSGHHDSGSGSGSGSLGTGSGSGSSGGRSPSGHHSGESSHDGGSSSDDGQHLAPPPILPTDAQPSSGGEIPLATSGSDSSGSGSTSSGSGDGGSSSGSGDDGGLHSVDDGSGGGGSDDGGGGG